MPEVCRIPELGQQQPRCLPDAGVSVSLCSAAGCSARQVYGLVEKTCCPSSSRPGEEQLTRFTNPGGDTYRGVCDEKGKPHGHGLWTFAKGGDYEGLFKRNKRHGQGVMRYRDGSRYTGRWEDGQRHGAGEFFTEKEGLAYRGGWRKGKKHGKGEEWRRGIRYSVRYEKDELKEEMASGQLSPNPEFKEHSRSSSSVSVPQPDVQLSHRRSDVHTDEPAIVHALAEAEDREAVVSRRVYIVGEARTAARAAADAAEDRCLGTTEPVPPVSHVPYPLPSSPALVPSQAKTKTGEVKEVVHQSLRQTHEQLSAEALEHIMGYL